MKTLSATQPGWYVVPVVYVNEPGKRGQGQLVSVDKEALPYAYPVAFWSTDNHDRVLAGFTKDGDVREVYANEAVLIGDFEEAGGHQQPLAHWKIMHKVQLPHNVKAV